MFIFNNMPSKEEIILSHDSQWKMIENEMCKLTNITMLSIVEGKGAVRMGESPHYGIISFRCNGSDFQGYIDHEIDFVNFVYAHTTMKIEEKTGNKKEVLFMWTRTKYSNRLIHFFSLGLPKFCMMICNEGSYKMWSFTWAELKKKNGPLKFSVIAEMCEATKIWKPEIMEKDLMEMDLIEKDFIA